MVLMENKRNSVNRIMRNLAIFILLLCIVSCKTSKNQYFVYKPRVAIYTFDKPYNNDEIKDSITLKQIDVNDSRIFALLDTVLQASENCFFIKDNQPTRYTVFIDKYYDTLKFSVQVEQYDYVYYVGRFMIDRGSRFLDDCKPSYFFSYKDNSVFVIARNSALLSPFFTITDIEEKFNIKFDRITAYYTDYLYRDDLSGSDYCFYQWFYIDGNFYPNYKVDCVPDSTWRECGVERYERLNNNIRRLSPSKSRCKHK